MLEGYFSLRTRKAMVSKLVLVERSVKGGSGTTTGSKSRVFLCLGVLGVGYQGMVVIRKAEGESRVSRGGFEPE